MIHDDQTRLRANLTIIPQSSEAYKKFLDKFVAQEARSNACRRKCGKGRLPCRDCTRTTKRPAPA